MYENGSKDFQKTRHFSPQLIDSVSVMRYIFLLKKKIKWGMENNIKWELEGTLYAPADIQYLIVIFFSNSKLSQ